MKVLAPVHAVPTTACPYHQAFDVDAAGTAVVPACKQPTIAYRRKSFVAPGEGQIVTMIPGPPAAAQNVSPSASSRAGQLTWFVDGAPGFITVLAK